MSTKYFKSDVTTTTHVWYKLLDSEGTLIQSYAEQSCFSAIFRYAISERTASILMYHKRDAIPYKQKEVERWIADLNEVGFPIQLDVGEIEYNFTLTLSKYLGKAHMLGALMLIRCLTENGINRIPDAYFIALDSNPAADKLDAIQNAHKGLGMWTVSNHMVCSKHTGATNVSRETLFGRYANEGISVHGGASYQSQKWMA